jgi:hypothetical protein
VPPGREDAQGDGDNDGKENRAQRQSQRRLETLRDQFHDGFLVIERLTQVAAQQPSHPDAELHDNRPVQPQAFAHLLDLFDGGAVTRDDRGGIAQRETRQRKHHDDDRQHHG